MYNGNDKTMRDVIAKKQKQKPMRTERFVQKRQEHKQNKKNSRKYGKRDEKSANFQDGIVKK